MDDHRARHVQPQRNDHAELMADNESTMTAIGRKLPPTFLLS